MSKKLFVASLPWKTTDSDLANLFAEFGEVYSAHVMVDRDTGRSRGFGFVEFYSETAAKAAIEKLNGAEFEGRKLVVNEAKPREEK